ncbi:acyltransferase [Butyricimonas virosa]|uniref:acyltransferase n=1 Tax=Butyricimonas virosa TaxID=544645 RepID=UPI00242D6EA8|nr:acyltransferase [Butyricimonas virosa]
MISRYSIRQYFWNFVVNGVTMSYILPSKIRVLILNMLNCKIEEVIQGHCIILSNKLRMGKHSYINRNCLIDNAEEYINIGNNCAIACKVSIHTTNHDYSNSCRRAGKIKSFPVVIKDGCWIGANVIILPGTIINDGCVVAAGSVVKGILDSNSMYAGNPAIKIKKF